MKSFRNLILSLLLAAGAAGLAACEGERGPVGEAGPTGTAGTAGAKGETGDAGKSSDEIPSAYEFLKTWGKDDGMAACNDDIFDKMKMAAFPGPATLGKATAQQKVPHNTKLSPEVDIGDPAVDADKGKCSDKVFIVTTGTGNARKGKPFAFTPTQVGKKMTEDPKMGTTPVLRNRTLTTTEKEFWGGTVTVDLKPDRPEVEGMDRLAVRCDAGKRPVDVTGGKRITGEYRIILITETKNLLEKDVGGSNIIKVETVNNNNVFETQTYTTQVCIRLASVPGTVKCYVKTAVQRRNDRDDKQIGTGFAPTDQMALYKDGKLIQVMPMPYPRYNNLAGTGEDNFPFSGVGGALAPVQSNLLKAGKLCNFFVDGVIPCPSGENALFGGECR